MLVCWTLSMPNVGSWNGQWSGKDKLYAVVSKEKKSENIESILKTGYYHYSFGDGWSAGIKVKEIDSKEAKLIRKKSSGFCDYEWMISSIRKNGKIIEES